MARSSFSCEVLTPEGEVFNEEVEMISTRTTTKLRPSRHRVAVMSRNNSMRPVSAKVANTALLTWPCRSVSPSRSLSKVQCG